MQGFGKSLGFKFKVKIQVYTGLAKEIHLGFSAPACVEKCEQTFWPAQEMNVFNANTKTK